MPNDIKTNQPIYAGAPSVGLRNVGSYQVSGEPWITGSDDHAASQIKRYRFPFVSKEVSVTNMGTPIDGANYIFVHFVSGSGPTHSFASIGSGPATRDPKSDVFTGKHFVTLSGNSVKLNVWTALVEFTRTVTAHPSIMSSSISHLKTVPVDMIPPVAMTWT